VKPETNLNFGFVILSPDHNIGRLMTTVNSLKSQYPAADCVCVTGDDTPDEDFKEIAQVCRAVRGGGTITSLINTGIGQGHPEWNVILMEGTHVARGTIRKLFFAIRDKKDVIFPLVVLHDKQGKVSEIRSNFYNGTLNGMTVHRETFQEVGEMSDNPLEISKMFWGMGAADRGCKFKAIHGAKVM
jgi:hypothetical protein